ncbi:MAG: DUF1800 domain-containing protein, partial [Sphingomonadaceae bacterium]|nr:DUF1800 domain-containing protein [Sphingomonadaceae bacterium]
MRDEIEFGERAPAGDDVQGADAAQLPANIAFIAASALTLAACGSGGASPTPSPTPTAAAPAPPTSMQVGRLLSQATMGATDADIARVQSLGYAGWVDEQLAKPRATTHWDWMIAKGYGGPANTSDLTGFDATIWRQLISGDDQLRQRVGLALSEILVVAANGLETTYPQFMAAAYLDVLWDNAFGSFRTILQQLSTNMAMGEWLTFMSSRKADPATGSMPDENYARELMQLFTIGLVQLNMDGTVKTNGGVPIETYTQDDILGLARVFTGYIPSTWDATSASIDRNRQPMITRDDWYETGAKTFLGTTIPAGTDAAASLMAALDAIFAHSNVPPFISKQLIQRLVTSNPTPAYVGRVAAVFADNGSGVRGDLKAVVRAILLDSEARDDTIATGVSFGKLREPIMRLTNWARAFGVASPSDAWAIGDTSNTTTKLGESPGRSPSVFNFYRPGYTPPSTAIQAQGLVAPEFQIASELTTVGYINYMNSLIVNGVGDVKPNYADLVAKAADSSALIDAINVRLAGGQLSAATIATIKSAIDSISATGANGPINRVTTAILLTMATADYLVQ